MDVFQIRQLPFLTRRNFLNEFQHLLFWSIFVGVVEGQFASVVVSKTFGASDFLIAVATAAPFAANIFSLGWGMLCIGRPKVRLATMFGAGAVLCVGSVALVPPTGHGAAWFIAQMAAGQVLLAGVVTVRSAIWKSNYPVEVRGQVAARLHRVRSLISVLTVQAAAAICDGDPEAYRFVFPAAALCGAVGIALLSRIRIRGERSQLRRLVSEQARGQTKSSGRLSLWRAIWPGFSLPIMWRVLVEDPRFSYYCVAQFLHGLSNLLTLPVVVAVVTRSLDTGDRGGFWISTGLVVGLPTLALLGSASRWGKLFDSEGVLRFRVINVLCWATALLFGLIGTVLVVSRKTPGPGEFLLTVGLFACRGIIYGIAQAGGHIAWNLGHLHFADENRAEVYMGIHVFLTGVRGLLAPLFGMWLWTLIGWPVWGIAIGLAFVSVGVYAALARTDPRDTHSSKSQV